MPTYNSPLTSTPAGYRSGKSVSDSSVQKDRQLLIDAGEKGKLSQLRAFTKLSGPGWLQSALTLGGGSLGSSLYLGILGGMTLLWLQPFAMILGVIMMSAISYVTLSTGERPFRAINNHINPVLGWSWLGAALLANMVWSLPQYSLCFAVCEQNFFLACLGKGECLATAISESGSFHLRFFSFARSLPGATVAATLA